MPRNPYLAIYEARRDRALGVIKALGQFAPEWAWIDRNLYEGLIAHETRRAERHATRKPFPWAWLRSVVSGWGFRVEVAGEAGL